MALLRKNIRQPDEIRPFTNGRMEIFNLGDLVVGRAVYQPGWRWSNDVKPLVGTELCEIHHQGFVVSGRLRTVLPDGPEMEVGPGDLFEIPPGHDAWVLGDEPWVSVDFSGRRYFGVAAPASHRRMVATILFTDIVESTPLLRRLGNAAWRDLVADHNERARSEIDRHRGREVATTGDGVLAVFESPADALRCGAAIIGAARELGLDVRAGAHSGEVEVPGADVRGLAVHTAARVMSAAGAGEVLASRTTRDLAEGSGLLFESRGPTALRGLEEPVELFAMLRGR